MFGWLRRLLGRELPHPESYPQILAVAKQRTHQRQVIAKFKEDQRREKYVTALCGEIHGSSKDRV